MILNAKSEVTKNPISIMIGKEKVTTENNAKLLGVLLDDNQKWKSQIESTISRAAVSIISVASYWLGRIEVWDKRTGFRA